MPELTQGPEPGPAESEPAGPGPAARRVRVLVSGDVQGVGFRWWCRQQAIGENVGGFVRNLPDGRVEAAFEGDPEAVERMVAWCRTGPGGATVDGVEAHDEELTGEDRFQILR